MPLSLAQKANFATLKRAFESDDVALVECRRKSDGKVVAVLCTVGKTSPEAPDDEEELQMSPFAELVADGQHNPFELYDPPDPDGGFREQVQGRAS